MRHKSFRKAGLAVILGAAMILSSGAGVWAEEVTATGSAPGI